MYVIGNTTKGGEGGSIAINLGAALANTGRDTVIVEATHGATDVMLGNELNVTEPTMSDVLAGNAPISAATRSGPDGIDIVPSGAACPPEISSVKMAAVIRALKQRYDIVLLHFDGEVSPPTLAPRGIDGVIVVTVRGQSGRRRATKIRSESDQPDFQFREAVPFGPGETQRMDKSALERGRSA